MGTQNRAVIGFVRYNGGLQQSAPGSASTLRGLTPKELASMPPHDTAGDSLRVPLHSHKHPGLYALVDSTDAELVNQYRWYVKTGWQKHRPPVFYAWAYDYSAGRGHQNRQHVQLHRLILNLSPADPDVDHIDGDGLNNRRSNLRHCTDSQNQANRHGATKPGSSSVFRGVTWDKACGKWRAIIRAQGTNHHLGLFVCEEDAARAYDRAARRIFGEFATCNFPEDEGIAA